MDRRVKPRDDEEADPLLRRQRQTDLRLDRGERFREPLALRIEQRGGARRGDCVDALRHPYTAFEHRRDHARLDQRVVRRAALPGVAVTLDQARAFGDFERQLGRELRRRDDAREPRLDRSLLLGVAPALWTEALELGEREEAQVAEDTRRLQLHAEIDSAQPAALLR